MLNSYLVLAFAIAGATIIWRVLVDDYPQLRARVCRIPIFGRSLVCGVCVSYWFSLAGLLATGHMQWDLSLIIHWFALGTAVLFVRSAVLATLDLAAILKHKHLQTHR